MVVVVEQGKQSQGRQRWQTKQQQNGGTWVCVVELEEGMKGKGADAQSKGISRGQTKTDSGRNSTGGDKDSSSCVTFGILQPGGRI